MSDDLCYLSATELAAMVRRREVSAVELLEAHLDRIDRVNPGLNAIVTLDPDGARELALAADARLMAGEELGPLHGLPVAHKDTHRTGGMRTTWGSPVFADHVPEDDELVVARLKQAGTVRVGKTNTPEFAAGSHTFNPVFGVTRNPYDTDRSAGGSSGGATAALAAGLVPVAEGSDMGGSLRNPAAFCNVVGLRTSPGRVPTFPAELGWSTLSVQGPMGRTVADVALGLSAMAGPDPRVPISLQDDGAIFRTDLPGRLDGVRVAWAPTLDGRLPVDHEVADVIARQVAVLEGLGATVEEACPDLDDAGEVFSVMRAWQFHTMLGKVVDEHADRVKESVRWNVEKGRTLSGADLGRNEVLHTRLHLTMVEFFERYDVLALPTSQVVPFPVEQEYPTTVAGEELDDYLAWMRSCSLISATGCPSLSVPAGFSDTGLPVGLQLVGPPRGDLAVLRIGHAFEQATGHGRTRPSL